MNYKQQQGMSLLGWITVLILVGFFASIAFKVIPHYMDNKTLDKLISAVESGNTSGQKVSSPAAFYALIEKGMEVNSIRHIKARDIMDVRAEGGVLLVHVKYEAREAVVKNLGVVLSFDKEYRVRTQ